MSQIPEEGLILHSLPRCRRQSCTVSANLTPLLGQPLLYRIRSLQSSPAATANSAQPQQTSHPSLANLCCTA